MMKQHTAKRISGKKVAITIVTVLVLLAVGAVYYTLQRVRTVVHLQYSGSNLIVLSHGFYLFAAENDERFPTQSEWPDALLKDGTIDPTTLVSPIEDGDGISYIYVPGPFTFDETQILIYEDPKHWPKKGVLVGFADNHVEFVPFDEFNQMLAAQLASTEIDP